MAVLFEVLTISEGFLPNTCYDYFIYLVLKAAIAHYFRPLLLERGSGIRNDNVVGYGASPFEKCPAVGIFFMSKDLKNSIQRTLDIFKIFYLKNY